MVQAAGTNVSLRYVRERVKGTTPAAVATLTDTIAAVASGTKFTRASGSFIDDGFEEGQYVKTTGFTTGDNNGTWLVTGVTATELTVDDPGTLITDEIADAAQKVQILMQTLRATGRNINLGKGTLESAEVREDRQVSDVRHGFNQVNGNPGFELSREAYDDMLQYMFASAWASVTGVSGVDIGSSTSTKKFDRASGSFITDGYRPGDIVRVAGFTGGDAGNNGDWLVTAVSALELTVYDPNDDMTTVAAGAGRTIDYPGKRLDIGKVMYSMTVERAFSDVSVYEVFKGVVLDQMALSIQPEAIVGGSFTLLGMSADDPAGSALSPDDPRAAAQHSPFGAFDGLIFEGGANIAVATGLDLQLANQRSVAPVIGSKFSPDVFEGILNLTGTLTAFLESAALLNKFRQESESSMYLKLEDVDDATNFMSIVMPRLKYVGEEIDPPQTGPVVISQPFRGLVKTGLAAASGATVDSCITIQRSNA